MRRKVIVIVLLVAFPVGMLLAQQTPPVSTQPAGAQKSLAATLNVYVFPSAGQAASQQSKDESECYQWAVQNTGTDPFAAQKQAQAAQEQAAQQQQQVQQSTQGAGAKGAVKGAAAGALIGEVASNDADEGAAYGAAAGAVMARRGAKKAQAQAQQQTQQQVQQAQALSKEQIDAFHKAFSVCLEAKKYMVKY
ncbi:MAG TPA: hypothetical protein VK864_12120 [Longimicrobiales bacterium]|nr:hypothetical protein [Longimicrobiales bacterium]